MVKPSVGTAVFDPGPGPPMASLLPKVGRGGKKSDTFHLRQVSVCTGRGVGLVSEIYRRQSSGSKLVKNYLLCFDQMLFLSAAQIPQVLDSGRGMLLDTIFLFSEPRGGCECFSKNNQQFPSRTPEDHSQFLFPSVFLSVCVYTQASAAWGVFGRLLFLSSSAIIAMCSENTMTQIPDCHCELMRPINLASSWKFTE